MLVKFFSFGKRESTPGSAPGKQRLQLQCERPARRRRRGPAHGRPSAHGRPWRPRVRCGRLGQARPGPRPQPRPARGGGEGRAPAGGPRGAPLASPPPRAATGVELPPAAEERGGGPGGQRGGRGRPAPLCDSPARAAASSILWSWRRAGKASGHFFTRAPSSPPPPRPTGPATAHRSVPAPPPPARRWERPCASGPHGHPAPRGGSRGAMRRHLPGVRSPYADASAPRHPCPPPPAHRSASAATPGHRTRRAPCAHGPCPPRPGLPHAAAPHLRGAGKPVAKKTDGVITAPYIPCVGAGPEGHVTTPGGPEAPPPQPRPRGQRALPGPERGGCGTSGAVPSSSGPRGHRRQRRRRLLCPSGLAVCRGSSAGGAVPAERGEGSAAPFQPRIGSDQAEPAGGAASSENGVAGAPSARSAPGAAPPVEAGPQRSPRAGEIGPRCTTARSGGVRQPESVRGEKPWAN